MLRHLPVFVFYEVNYVTLDNDRINGRRLRQDLRDLLSNTFIFSSSGNGGCPPSHEQGQGSLRYRKSHHFRGTPLLLQILAVTYGPHYLLGADVSKNKLIPVVIAFAINYAAYFAEIYRGGIESMAIGQYEAADVLGYSKFQTFIHIILPQVIKRIMPSITNEIVTLVKDTSLAFAVSYQEMFTIGKQIANSQTSFIPFLVAGVFYYVFNAIVDFVMARVEKKMNYYH